MSQESIKKTGFLGKLPVKGLVKKWSRRWFILHGTSHEGVVRIEYYDSQEFAQSGIGKRTIPLRDIRDLCTAPGNKLHPYMFQLTSQIGHHVLAADSQPELDDWMDQIKKAVQEDRIRRRRTKGQSLVVTSADEKSFEYTDSGISYKNMVDSGSYRVTVEETETSVKMCLSGTYSLELSPTALSLTAPSGAKIFTLSYKFLRNYGKQSGQFHFETGKNSPIGEGKLIFVTTCSKEVFGVVHNNIKKLRENARPHEPVRKTSSEARPGPDQRKQTQPVSRPQPFQSVPAPPLPQKRRPSRSSASNRPSSEIADNPVVGTYRVSKDLEEMGEVSTVDTSATYAKVDMNKKRSSKMHQQKKKNPPTQPQPYDKNPSSKPNPGEPQNPSSKPNPGEAAIYSDPYEADPAYRPPPVPVHQNSVTHDRRFSTDLVNLEEDAFYDSFEDEDENLEPLAEGVSNPLDEGDFADFGGENVQTLKPETLTTADNVDRELESLDFGFGPGNLSPSPAGVAPENPQGVNLFDFDFGGDLGALPVRGNDPFSSNLAGVGATGNQDFSEFDLGKLDANFFEKLEAIEVSDQQQPACGAGPQNRNMNKQEFDQFWSNVDTSVSKLK